MFSRHYPDATFHFSCLIPMSVSSVTSEKSICWRLMSVHLEGGLWSDLNVQGSWCASNKHQQTHISSAHTPSCVNPRVSPSQVGRKAPDTSPGPCKGFRSWESWESEPWMKVWSSEQDARGVVQEWEWMAMTSFRIRKLKLKLWHLHTQRSWVQIK